MAESTGVEPAHALRRNGLASRRVTVPPTLQTSVIIAYLCLNREYVEFYP